MPSAVMPSARWSAFTPDLGIFATLALTGPYAPPVPATASPPPRASVAPSTASPPANARRRTGRRLIDTQGTSLGHHAYGVSCRARAYDLRYAAHWRRFAPRDFVSLWVPRS